MTVQTVSSLQLDGTIVDTKLDKTHYRQGEWVLGEVIISSDIATSLENITLSLVIPMGTQAEEEYLMADYLLTESVQVEANKTVHIPFRFELPWDTPVTLDQYPIFIRTDIQSGEEYYLSEMGEIEIFPHPLVENVLGVMEQQAFQLFNVEYNFNKETEMHPFAQEFTFQPPESITQDLAETKVIFDPIDEEEKVDIRIELLSPQQESTQFQLLVNKTNHDASQFEDQLIHILNEYLQIS
ncbi:sporulation protein [Mechercharimyces sp. CAU 1602]|uniref:sporulation protein n=1 Tax=Mechercharimyces sp. CAU 1602 TaxID=2973933 RepID=UPI0021637D79|nr:sporulation protein [Mechercharimyces sp. CAU 1602]MCS1352128.1 sporulation protein [Mechercharimyces sp. CAU 1602]